MYTSRDILNAIEAAPTMLYSANAADMRSQDSFSDTDASRSAPNIDGPALVVATPGDFKRMLEDINDVLGGERPEADIDDDVRHESAHARAAAKVGAIATHYGVRFYRVVDLSGEKEPYVSTEPFTKHSFNRKMPALVLASVLAYPLDPSHGDVADIQGLGYSDVAEVGQHIYQANRQNDLALPVPLSWRSYGGEEQFVSRIEPMLFGTQNGQAWAAEPVA